MTEQLTTLGPSLSFSFVVVFLVALTAAAAAVVVVVVVVQFNSTTDKML